MTDNADFSTSAPLPIRLGFVPLTDCAPLVAARKLGLDRAHGLDFQLQRQPSWAAVRDKLIAGQLDAAQALYGLVYGMQLGLSGPQCDMAILMTLNQNGQGISLAPPLAEQWRAGVGLAAIARRLGRPLVLAHTFPTGTHAMWLYYWLAAQGVHPFRDVKCVVIPPPQMSQAMQAGMLDGFCAGQPWHAVAERDGVAVPVADSSSIWLDHPEKVLTCRRDMARQRPLLAQRLIQVLLLACRWLDRLENRAQAAAWLAEDDYLAMPAALILRHWPNRAPQSGDLRFCDEGRVNFPYRSDGLWFLQQYRRWGMWQGEPGAEWVDPLNQTELYRAAAGLCGLPLPDSADRDGVLMDDMTGPTMFAAPHNAGANRGADALLQCINRRS
ncbi:CmpA/NrtA family ABC transporter substrate-binding protein [Paludibacterium purpuratum]|uniref:Nitrate/nitrite transport system substrate-binding protein n=1 Tax=Paludibacterium purpuratum TaxID=1144873 RepID=A0A4R7AZ08_9NEIS|nr:CmpA/NrtA family ABC transporter substrate-binding protein [Paludibacterium purpuratum]TDR73320.1 nitrate/nitrite transport system substrate-binding protein [Paludibacterium purpuratum]